MAAARTRRKARRPASRRPAPTRRGGEATREHILATAERLIAEQGASVSIRQIGEAAGQGNKSAVAYHFGSRTDLVLAIARRHAPEIERRREAMLRALNRSDDLADWLSCLVKPITDHLASLGAPSWYARFLAHAVSDPALREVVFADALTSPSMQQAMEGATVRLPRLPADVFEARGFMTQHLIVHTCADRERALQSSKRALLPSWQATCDAMVDALIGLWRAPVRRASAPK